jgi:hypothetical protein
MGVIPTLWNLVRGLIDKEAIDTIGYGELSNSKLINEHSMNRLFVLSADVATHEKFTRGHDNHSGFDY